MRVQGNGPCIFPKRKKILREVDARDVVVMRSFGEKNEDVLVLAVITHQVVQHKNTWSQIFGKQALNVFRDALVEMDLFAMHVLETTLGFSVAIHDQSDGSIKSTGSRSQQLSGKRRFAALAGPRHNDAARRNRNKYNVELVFWTRYIAHNSREMSLAKVCVEKRFSQTTQHDDRCLDGCPG